ncbi:MAG: ribonuclease HII [Aquificae bacterium]|nr:ribonuclease HII [Aquificota bacterium]
MELPEREFWERGLPVAGLDEAGRGPLAGPVVVACVVFPPGTEPFLDKDSKKLSPAERALLFEKIVKRALFVGVSFATPREVEAFNVYRATKRAYARALRAVPFKLGAAFTDFMPLENFPFPVISEAKADERVFSVAAASVVAKVVRDRIMELYAKRHPGYGFEKHKGYPTREHLEALSRLGPSEIHRTSYGPVKRLFDRKGED